MDDPNYTPIEIEDQPNARLAELFQILYQVALEQQMVNKLTAKQIATAYAVSKTYTYRIANPDDDRMPDYSRKKYIAELAKALNVLLLEDASGNVVHEPIEVVTSELGKEENVLHYIYYYGGFQGRDFEVYVGHIEVDFSHDTARLDLFATQQPSNVSDDPDADPKISNTYKGVISSAGDQTYLEFRRPHSEGGSFYLGLTILSVAKHRFKDGQQYIHATYASREPSAGASLLERCEQSEIRSRVLERPVPDYVEMILRNRRYEPTRKHAKLFDVKEAKERIARMKSAFKTNYIGFSIRESKAGTDLRKLHFKVSKGFRVERRVTATGTITIGNISEVGDNLYKWQFDYDAAADNYALTINLQTNYTFGRKDLEKYPGIIAGSYTMMTTKNRPAGGRVILIPVADDAVVVPEKIKVSNTQRLTELNSQYPFLKTFFAGLLDTFIDSPLRHDPPLLRNYSEVHTGHSRLYCFAGTYLCFRLSSKKDRVHICPIRIHEDGGRVERFRSFQDLDNRVMLFGRARIHSGNILAISYDNFVPFIRGKSESVSTTRFTTVTRSSSDTKKLQNFEAMSTRVGAERKPTAIREVYIRVDPNIDLSKHILSVTDPQRMKHLSEYRATVEKMLADPDQYILEGIRN